MSIRSTDAKCDSLYLSKSVPKAEVSRRDCGEHECESPSQSASTTVYNWIKADKWQQKYIKKTHQNSGQQEPFHKFTCLSYSLKEPRSF